MEKHVLVLYTVKKTSIVDTITLLRRESMTRKYKMLKPSAYFLLLG
jgi:hypothetical protein